jgi:hypothetical protein
MRTRTRLSRITLGGLVSVLVLSSGIAARTSFAQAVVAGAYSDVSLEVFDRALAPYGEWVTVGRFGRAWRPYATIVGADFQPYLTGGHWVYTDYGWSFESDYDWGWAPFHYGRWMPDDYYGWVWVPDTVWGPSWVDWRFGGGYVGWAPLAPVGFSFGFGFGRPEWCFVPVTHFVVADVYHYAVPVERLHWAYSVTSRVYQPVHYAGAQWNGGPPPGHVAQVTGHPIQPVSIAPPSPGRVQAVRLGPPSGVSTTVSSGSPGVRPLPPTASGGHPRDGAPSGPPAFANHPPSGAPSANNLPAAPSHGEPQWGHAPAGDTRHWGHAPEGDTSHWGHGAPGSVQMPPQAAPQPAPAAGHPTSGGFTPRTAPANQYVRPLPFSTSQPAPQYHAPPTRAYAPPVFNAPNRASPPMAYRSAPSPQTFASVHSAPTPHFSAGHVSGGFGGRAHR